MRPTLDIRTVHRAVARLLAVLPRTNGPMVLMVRPDGELDVCSTGASAVQAAQARDGVIGVYAWTALGAPTAEQIRADVDAWRKEVSA